MLLSGAALALAAAFDDYTGALPSWEDPILTAGLALVLGRTVFVPLIEERNRVLAENIRQACLDSPGLDQQPDIESSSPGSSDDVAMASVVAVVGMVHLEGVRAALLRDPRYEGYEA